MNDIKISAVIPCLNEAKTISDVVKEALSGIEMSGLSGEVVVADNGSTDGSQDLARSAGARVISVPQRGYGAALHYGILEARGTFVILGDADMSYDFTLIPRFKNYILEIDEKHTMDFVLGSRLGGQIDEGAMPFLNQYLGTPVLNLVIFLFFGLKTSDCNSGMRLIRSEFYRKLPMRAPGMEWASELIIKSKIMNSRYSEVPIRLRKDQRGRPPHLRRWRDGWRHLKTIVLLSPNRLIFTPSAGVTLLGLLQIEGNLAMGLSLLLVGMIGFCLGLLVKLVLHADGVLESKMVSKLLSIPFTEYLLGSGVVCMLLGFLGWLFLPFTFVYAFLILAGTVLSFSSFTWGVIISHTINLLRSKNL